MMNIIQPAAIFCLLFLSSCSTSLFTTLYDEGPDSKNQGITYNLPKNLVKVEVTYTVNEPRRVTKGLDEPVENGIWITVEDPVIISTLLVADKSKTFLISHNKMSDQFFLKSEVDIKLSDNGLLSAIDSDVEDKSIDFAESIVVSTANLAKFFWTGGMLKAEGLEKDAWDEILALQEKIPGMTKKEDIDLAIKKIDFLKSQIKWFQENYKTYLKKTKVKYTVIFDPGEIYQKSGSWSEISNGLVLHHIFPDHIFPDQSKFTDTLTVSFPLIKSPGFNAILPGENLSGVLYRSPASVNIDITSNGRLLATNAMYLAQYGKTSMIPVNSKKGGKKKTSLVFSEKTGGLTNHKVVSGSSSEKLSKSLKESVTAVQETIEYLKFEAEIKELEKLKTIKELKDALKEPEEEVEEPETEFEKQIREFKEQQQLLEMELMIKQLKKEIEELSGGE